jgi:hypothetical protein
MNSKLNQILKELNEESDEFMCICLRDIELADIDKMIEEDEIIDYIHKLMAERKDELKK